MALRRYGGSALKVRFGRIVFGPQVGGSDGGRCRPSGSGVAHVGLARTATVHLLNVI